MAPPDHRMLSATTTAITGSRIAHPVAVHGEGALEAHDVRTRHAGQVTFIDFHLVVPGEMTVGTAPRKGARLR
jgi:divalent metal cation (Fe/Co/Zn/Cd) transporter